MGRAIGTIAATPALSVFAWSLPSFLVLDFRFQISELWAAGLVVYLCVYRRFPKLGRIGRLFNERSIVI